jgi:hypothetical protein
MFGIGVLLGMAFDIGLDLGFRNHIKWQYNIVSAIGISGVVTIFNYVKRTNVRIITITEDNDHG